MAQPNPTAAAGRSAGLGVLLAACVSALVVNANTSKGRPGLQLPPNQQPPEPIPHRSPSLVQRTDSCTALPPPR
jgi:hypothetical protein